VPVEAQRGSTAVAYIDDYRTSADAPLVASESMPNTAGTDTPVTDDTGAPTTTDGTETPVTTTDAEPTASSGGSSGGGCSIDGARSDGLTWLFGLFTVGALVVRRRRAASL